MFEVLPGRRQRRQRAADRVRDAPQPASSRIFRPFSVASLFTAPSAPSRCSSDGHNILLMTDGYKFSHHKQCAAAMTWSGGDAARSVLTPPRRPQVPGLMDARARSARLAERRVLPSRALPAHQQGAGRQAAAARHRAGRRQRLARAHHQRIDRGGQGARVRGEARRGVRVLLLPRTAARPLGCRTCPYAPRTATPNWRAAVSEPQPHLAHPTLGTRAGRGGRGSGHHLCVRGGGVRGPA